LEEEAGTQLIICGCNLAFMKVGERFAEGTREILKVRDHMLKDIAGIIDRRNKKVIIGIPTYCSN
jgi:hypothetical protein